MRKELRAKLVVIYRLCPRLPCDHYCRGVSRLFSRVEGFLIRKIHRDGR